MPGTEGRTQILATLKDAPDSARARTTVDRLRASLAGTGALVGGRSAQLADLHQVSVRGHRLIMPLALVVVLAVLVVLLCCLLLPLLLIAAAWASPFTALGVDYNIFLVHRIRGEAVRHGTTAGVRTTRGSSAPQDSSWPPPSPRSP
ncbi:MMPL family transporter [Streptomyces filamentosus]|uniref:MMPL family transporter n=1 Tax=Streptomyces filamentosus TaxID=67294 RepID=UPI0033DD4D2B